MIDRKNGGKLKMTVCIESYKGNGNYCEIEITEGYTNIVYVVVFARLLMIHLLDTQLEKQYIR